MSVKVSTTGITVDGGTVLQIKTGNEAYGKILVSDSNGTVDWVSPRGLVSVERYIGERYGGGIVVAIWDDGDDQKVMIAYPNDVQTTNYTNDTVNPLTTWTNNYLPFNDYTSTLVNASSLYDGAANTVTAKSIFPFPPGNSRDTGSAISFSTNNFNGFGYSDWYLPSIYEMKAMFANAHAVNRVLGEGNFMIGPRYNTPKYWTSTEVNATNAWILDATMTGPIFTAVSKGSVARMRPVRIENRSVGNGLATSLDATNKTSYNDNKLSGRWSDLVNYGLTSSYSFTFSSIDSTGPTYSSLQGGYLYFNGNSYINMYSPIGNTNVVTVEMWARIKPQSANRMLFGWSTYDVYWVSDKGLGFNTGSGDVYGIPTATVTSLGIVDRWVHYVFEMRSGVDYSNNKIYIDGFTQSLVQCVGTQNIGNTNFGGGNGRIGCWTVSLLTGGGTPYLGVFDLSVFKIYKRALTQAEVNLGYNKYRRKYEIGIPSTHSLDNGVGTGTFSISQNLQLNLAGKKNLKVLKSTSLGTASWVDKNYLFYRPDNERFVGDLYGGGVIVNSWRYPANVFNYVIMSTVDVSTGVAWSNVTNAIIFTGGSPFSPGSNSWFQDFNGPTNSALITSQVGHSTSAAKLCSDYTGGFSGWYLPAVQELSDAFKNLAAVGYVAGTSSFRGRYWTSSEFGNGTASYAFDTGSATQSAYWFMAHKNTSLKVRAFRRATVLANYKVWNQNAPEDEPTGDWYVDPWDEKNWRQYNGIRSSNLVFTFDPSNVNSYKGRISGLQGTAVDTAGGRTGLVRSLVEWISDSAVLSYNGTYSTNNTWPINSCVKFSGAVQTTNYVTMEAWVKPTYPVDPLAPTSSGVVCTQGLESTPTALWGFNLAVSKNSGDTYNLSIEAGNGLGLALSNRKTFTTTNRPLVKNIWHHVVGVMNGVTLVGLYVNGVAQPTVAEGTGTFVAVLGGGTSVLVGASWGGIKNVFGGQIGPVRIYDEQLTVQQVKDNFEKDRFRFGL